MDILFTVSLGVCLGVFLYYRYRHRLRNNYKITHGEEIIYCYSMSVCNGWVRAYDFDNNVIGRFRTTKVNIEKI